MNGSSSFVDSNAKIFVSSEGWLRNTAVSSQYEAEFRTEYIRGQFSGMDISDYEKL